MRVTVHMMRGNREVPAVDSYSDTDEPGEGAQAEPQVRTIECDIYSESVRCFYPAPQRESGCRITFRDGGGFVVTESLEELRALLPDGVTRQH